MPQTMLDGRVARHELRPAPDHLTAFFWEAALRHELAIQKCDGCGYFNHWPVPRCKKCWSTALSPTKVSGQATVYTFAVATQAFHPWFESRLPFVVAVIELAEQSGLKLVSNVIGCPVDDVHCGMAVEVTFEDVEEGFTLPMFRPAATRGLGQ